MKLATPLAAAAALALFATSAAAQSSKFTAAYDTDGVVLALAYDNSSIGSPDFDIGFAAHMGKIKAPQGKELLIGLSAVPGLVTFTKAKGRNKAGASESVAVAGVGAAIRYAHVNDLPAGYDAGDVCSDPDSATAAPGIVPLSVRLQYLSVDVDLDVLDTELENCDAGDPANDADCLSATLLIDGDVTVALGLATAAAHHFNFLAADLEKSGDHAVAACFVGVAVADLIAGEGSALSIAALGKRMMTVQEVRAVKDTGFGVGSEYLSIVD